MSAEIVLESTHDLRLHDRVQFRRSHPTFHGRYADVVGYGSDTVQVQVREGGCLVTVEVPLDDLFNTSADRRARTHEAVDRHASIRQWADVWHAFEAAVARRRGYLIRQKASAMQPNTRAYWSARIAELDHVLGLLDGEIVREFQAPGAQRGGR